MAIEASKPALPPCPPLALLLSKLTAGKIRHFFIFNCSVINHFSPLSLSEHTVGMKEDGCGLKLLHEFLLLTVKF